MKRARRVFVFFSAAKRLVFYFFVVCCRLELLFVRKYKFYSLINVFNVYEFDFTGEFLHAVAVFGGQNDFFRAQPYAFRDAFFGLRNASYFARQTYFAESADFFRYGYIVRSAC